MSDSVRRAYRLMLGRFKLTTTNSGNISSESNSSGQQEENSSTSGGTSGTVHVNHVEAITSSETNSETPLVEDQQPHSASINDSTDVLSRPEEASTSTAEVDQNRDSATEVTTATNADGPEGGHPTTSPPARSIALTMNLTLNIRHHHHHHQQHHRALHHHLHAHPPDFESMEGGGGGGAADGTAGTEDNAAGAAHQMGGGGGGHAHPAMAGAILRPGVGVFFDPVDPVIARARHRLYSLLLLRAAMAYFLTIPSIFRKALEWSVLALAIASFALLIHLHIIFIRSPLTCLDSVSTTWPRNGILRVQIGYNLEGAEQQQTSVEATMAKIEASLRNLSSIDPKSRRPLLLPLTLEQYRLQTAANAVLDGTQHQSSGFVSKTSPDVPYSHLLNESSLNLKEAELLRTIEFYPKMHGAWPQPYMVEYSLEYGLLRLSEEMRSHYKVPVLTVNLCPDRDACFGDPFARFMLHNFLGYDDVLIGSIKRIAEKENNRGYVRNVATGEHFRFVNVWMTRASYIAAAFIMIIFTLFVSMLIRYSHQQVFVFVSEFLRTMEMQQPFSRITMLTASLITVVLALIGMEAIMYEFFSDSSIAFHVIIMVWAADQFDSMAIRSPISKRHFLRFFYLYQFSFYAYHYRFNGQYGGLALLTTMLFTYHAMIFFFHRFELPLVQALDEAMTGGGGGGGRAGRQQRPPAEPRIDQASQTAGGVTSSTDGTSQTEVQQQSADREAMTSSDANNNNAEATPLPPSSGHTHHHHFTIRHHICTSAHHHHSGHPRLVSTVAAATETALSDASRERSSTDAVPQTQSSSSASSSDNSINSLGDLEID